MLENFLGKQEPITHRSERAYRLHLTQGKGATHDDQRAKLTGGIILVLRGSSGQRVFWLRSPRFVFLDFDTN